MLNKQKGNMYGFVTHTWNAIKGKCSHGCSYCYMKNFWKSDVHLDKKELKQDLGEGNFIFVGSSTDMFADGLSSEWIIKTLEHCKEYPKNTYLFQTKNPRRLQYFLSYIPKDSILGLTLETNKENNCDNAPGRRERSEWMETYSYLRTMVTIEPIMDFDLIPFAEMIKKINPESVNIGADSKGHNLPEPSSEKIGELIEELSQFAKVNLKDNLKRLYALPQDGGQHGNS